MACPIEYLKSGNTFQGPERTVFRLICCTDDAAIFHKLKYDLMNGYHPESETEYVFFIREVLNDFDYILL